MAGRKRKAKITLPGFGGRVIIETDVPDPYAPERRERVRKLIYDKTIERMAIDGKLRSPTEGQDGTEARLIAANRFMALYGRCGGSGARAIDYSAIKVDVSRRYNGTPEGQAMALREMADLRQAIGWQAHELLHAVVCNATAATLLSKRRGNDTFYQDVRAALDGVIDFYGIARGRVLKSVKIYGYDNAIS